MAKTDQIKSPHQKWRAWNLIILGLTLQKILKFNWWVFIDVESVIAKGFLKLLNFGQLIYCSKTARIRLTASYSRKINIIKHHLRLTPDQVLEQVTCWNSHSTATSTIIGSKSIESLFMWRIFRAKYWGWPHDCLDRGKCRESRELPLAIISIE